MASEIDRRKGKYLPERKPHNSYPFTGLITCGRCGGIYRRTIANSGTNYAKPAWMCLNRDQGGKGACGSKQIPETILMELTAEVLGKPKFDTHAFHEQIKNICALDDHQLLFIFQDGRQIQCRWQNRSRSESWTDQMRQTARERKLKT